MWFVIVSSLILNLQNKNGNNIGKIKNKIAGKNNR